MSRLRIRGGAFLAAVLLAVTLVVPAPVSAVGPPASGPSIVPAQEDEVPPEPPLAGRIEYPGFGFAITLPPGWLREQQPSPELAMRGGVVQAFDHASRADYPA